MLKQIEKLAKVFLEKIKHKEVYIISHHDTDGITSAAILAKTLQRLDAKFSVRIIKQIEEEKIKNLPENKIVVFLDLSINFNYLSDLKNRDNIFIIDHHEINEEAPEKLKIINPILFDEEEISGAGLTYLFAKAINPENKDLANLAVLGMVGDMLDRNVSKLNNNIINDAEVKIKKGLLLYPATRPINKALEYSSSIFIPGVTGSSKGCIDILREAGIERINGSYKNLIELDDEEMSKLITLILLKRMCREKETDLIGNIYLIKFFSKLEDARESSAMINACSRLDYPGIALSMCLGDKNSKIKAEEIYTNYKQHLISALNFIQNLKKVEGKGYTIINAKDNIKDTIIGTVASILSNSKMYEEGTTIVTMAYTGEGKIKVSARISGRNGRNVHEMLHSIIKSLGGECGGHPMAAGCLIQQNQEQEFLKELTRQLSIELVKI